MSERGGGLNTPIQLKDDDFDQTISQHPLVIVDFWAEWCGPCHMVAPVIEELAREYGGKAVFGKLNVDENRGTAARFSIMSIPTLIIFKDGEEVDRIVGALPKAMLKDRVSKYL